MGWGIYFEGDTGGVYHVGSFKAACIEAKRLKRAYPGCYVEVIEVDPDFEA